MSESPVVVIGGGVVGLCAAYYLQQGGAEVTVVEAGQVGHGASWGNAGWVVPSLSGPVPGPGVMSYALRSVFKPDSPVYLRPTADPRLPGWLWRFARQCSSRAQHAGLAATLQLGARTMELFDDLADNGVAPSLRNDGLTLVALDRDVAQAELDHLRELEAHGYELPDALLEGAALREHEPSLSSSVRAGFHIARERHVDPRALTGALAERLRTGGAKILEDTAVTGFDQQQGAVRAVATGGGTIEASSVVIAAGAWSTPLAAMLGLRLPMRGGKGYSFSIKPAVQPRQPLYLLGAKVGVTPLGERLRVAGTMEISGLDVTVHRSRLDAMERSARRFLAAWPDTPRAEEWAGLRPLTADGLPVIGTVPGVANTFLATGHAMLGVTLGPSTGELLAGMILRGEDPEVLRPFSPARFRRQPR